MITSKIKRIVSSIVICVCLALFIFLAIASIHSPKYYELYKNGAQTIGKVIELTCKNKESLSYEYSVLGINYTGVTTASWTGKKCDQIALGDQLDITYSLDDPALSCAGNPKIRLYNELIPAALAGCTFSPFLLVVYQRNRATRRIPDIDSNAESRRRISSKIAWWVKAVVAPLLIGIAILVGLIMMILIMRQKINSGVILIPVYLGALGYFLFRWGFIVVGYDLFIVANELIVRNAGREDRFPIGNVIVEIPGLWSQFWNRGEFLILRLKTPCRFGNKIKFALPARPYFDKGIHPIAAELIRLSQNT